MERQDVIPAAIFLMMIVLIVFQVDTGMRLNRLEKDTAAILQTLNLPEDHD